MIKLLRHQRRNRRGLTLSEVLVSMLVMSIGVVAVATLFPLSVFRTIQATQLTNAAQLRYNFEGMAGARPELFAGTEAWQPGKQYLQGDLIVTSTPNEYYLECITAGTSGPLEPSWRGLGNTTQDTNTSGTNPEWQPHRARLYVVDPIGWHHRTEDLGVAPTLNTANNRNTFGRTNLAGVTIANDSRYRIMRFRGGIPGTGAAALVNPSNSLFYPDLSTAAGRNQSVAALYGARQMAVLPDSWVVQTDTTDIAMQASGTAMQLTNLPASLIQTLDRNNDNVVNFVLGSGAEQDFMGRVTFFDDTGAISHIRALNGITSPAAGVEELAWTSVLPTGFIPTRVKVETFETRYSWMLTGRRNGPTAYLNVVVFFRRASDVADELIHPAHFRSAAQGDWPGVNNNQVDPNRYLDDVADLSVDLLNNVTPVLRVGPGVGNQPGTTGVDDDANGTVDDRSELGYGDDVPLQNIVIVRYNNDVLAGERPALKRGGFICDAHNNRWYRILKFHEVDDVQPVHGLLDAASTASITPGRGAIVWLDSPILESSGRYHEDFSLPTPNSNSSNPGAILIPGVIDVYPLQPQLPWENN